MEQEPMTPEVETEIKQSNFTQVTSLSKYLAMILFILMPFVGGWIGYNYAPVKVVEVERVVVKEDIEKVEEKMDGVVRNGCDISGVANGFVVTPDGSITDIPELICSNPDLLIENSVKEFGSEGKGETIYIYKTTENSAYLISSSQYDQGNLTDAEFDILPIPDYVNVENLELIAENDRPHIKYLHDGNYLYIVSRFTWMGYSNFVFLSQSGIDKDSFEVLGDTLVRDDKRLFNLKTIRGLYEVIGVDPNEVVVYASHEPVSESLPLTLYRDNKTLRHGTTTIHNISNISAFEYLGFYYGWPSILNIYFEEDGRFFEYKARGGYNEKGERVFEGVKEIQENQIPSVEDLSDGLYI